jgi:histidinol-phosphate aminotransferase
VTIDCGRDGAFARRVVAALAERGVFVRMPFAAPQDRCIRVTTGTPDDLDLFEAVFPDALAAAAG